MDLRTGREGGTALQKTRNPMTPQGCASKTTTTCNTSLTQRSAPRSTGSTPPAKDCKEDATAGTEAGTDWTIAKLQGGDAYHDLFGLGEDKKSVCAHNETEQLAKSQYGGTCMMAFGVFSSHVKSPGLDPNKGKDKRGLGSYCSLVTTGEDTKPVRIVTYLLQT